MSHWNIPLLLLLPILLPDPLHGVPCLHPPPSPPPLPPCPCCPWTEAEHRSTFYIPYWNVPLLRAIVPRQRQFAADIRVINDTLDQLITLARNTAVAQDEEALQNRDYSQVWAGREVEGLGLGPSGGVGKAVWVGWGGVRMVEGDGGVLYAEGCGGGAGRGGGCRAL
jgi:hypothetical protein